MEKIESLDKSMYLKAIDYYRFSNEISIDDMNKIIDVLNNSNVKMLNFRLSNSEEQPEHYFRVFHTLNELHMCDLSDVYIDDFGVTCSFKNIEFDLTFDFSKNQVITITNGDINLEPLLLLIEQNTQKKTK